MATLVMDGMKLVQHEDYCVSVSRYGRAVCRFAFKRELTGEELSELAFWVKNV